MNGFDDYGQGKVHCLVYILHGLVLTTAVAQPVMLTGTYHKSITSLGIKRRFLEELLAMEEYWKIQDHSRLEGCAKCCKNFQCAQK